MKHTARGLIGLSVTVLTMAVLLAGCVVRVAGPAYAPPPPPPQPVYAAPAYAAPAPDAGEMQATEAPPPLPDYDQPPPPDDGYLWTPGYWAFGPAGYYWVPGTWVQPPRVGVLWTPGYWGFVGSVYVFHAGYWGPHVGFYGGVHYGYGYTGEGYAGGRWVGNSFAYNRSVTNVTNVTVIHNTYNETVVNNVTVNRVSFNGGAGGINAAASAQERQAAQEPHIAPTSLQTQHVQEASKNPSLFARSNNGRPPVAATPRPAVFNAPGVVGAHGAAAAPPRPSTFNAPPNNGGANANDSRNPINTAPSQGAPPRGPVTTTTQTPLVPPQANVGRPPVQGAPPKQGTPAKPPPKNAPYKQRQEKQE